MSIRFRAMRSILAFSLALAASAAQGGPRARDLGVPFDGDPGPLNAITDENPVHCVNAK